MGFIAAIIRPLPAESKKKEKSENFFSRGRIDQAAVKMYLFGDAQGDDRTGAQTCERYRLADLATD